MSRQGPSIGQIDVKEFWQLLHFLKDCEIDKRKIKGILTANHFCEKVPKERGDAFKSSRETRKHPQVRVVVYALEPLGAEVRVMPRQDRPRNPAAERIDAGSLPRPLKGPTDWLLDGKGRELSEIFYTITWNFKYNKPKILRKKLLGPVNQYSGLSQIDYLGFRSILLD